MITEEGLDAIITSLETRPVEMEEFYERMSDFYPTAVGWLTDRSDPLTSEEEDYFLYLGMIVLTIAADQDHVDPQPEQLEKCEEKVWEQINEDHPKSLEAQADKVDDDDVVGIFLIDALHSDDELPFLTPPGALAGFARLHALSKAFKLVSTQN